MHPLASFEFSEVKQTLLAQTGLQTHYSLYQVTPAQVSPQHSAISVASQLLPDNLQPESVIQTGHILAMYIYVHAFSPKQEVGFVLTASQPRHLSLLTAPSDYITEQLVPKLGRCSLTDPLDIQMTSSYFT